MNRTGLLTIFLAATAMFASAATTKHLKDNSRATNPPTASFTINMNELDVQFMNGSLDADSGYYDLGDGTIAFAPNPSHTYPGPGTYTACLFAFNDCGVDTFCMEIEVTCTPPTAGFVHVALGLQVGFSNNSSDYEQVVYDFGDGATSTDEDVFHVYSSPGTYTACMIASSACGTDTFCTEIEVTGTPINEYQLLQSFDVFPNPASEAISVDVSLNGASELLLSLTDLSGKVVWQEKTGKVTGNFFKEINIAALPPGIYNFSLQTHRHSFHRPLIKK